MTQPAEPNQEPTTQPDEVPAERAQELLDEIMPPFSLRFRWEWGLGILLVGSAAEAVVWNAFSPDRTYQVMWSIPAVSGTLFLLFLWWTFWSGLSWLARGVGLGGVALGLGVFVALFRFEGFNGDMWPRFSRRATPTAEERLQQFLTETKDENPAPPTIKKPAEDAPIEKPVEDAPAELTRLVADKFDWTGFRGPNRDGILTSEYEFDWTKPLEELWRHPVGRGWSSFAIVDGIAFTQEQREQGESVICYHLETGVTIWRHSDPVRFEEALGGVGPRATPTFSEGHLYTLGATGVLNCLNATNGDLVWQRDILDDAQVENIPWAMAGSPLVVGKLVIVNPGGKNGQGVIAYNKKTGTREWSGGSDRTSYTAPALRRVLGTNQVVIFDGVGIAGHSIEDGRENWKVKWSNDPQVNAAQPIVVSENQIFVGSGYGRGSGLIELKEEKGRVKTNVKWSSRRFKLKFNAAVRKGNYAYGLDEGVLSCIDMLDGTLKWKRGRYGYGQLLLVQDTLVIQAEQGDIGFVRATPEKFDEIGRVPALTSKTWNHPVIWENLLIVRNAEECICFKISGEKQPQVTSSTNNDQ
jgi:outer membrane protein assembly factor BamB